MAIPNLFIAGAQKSGTTSLHFLLKNHPDIFIPEDPQEIHFFDIDRNYERGLIWYENLFTGWQQEPIIAQTSPLYIYEPEVAQRIQKIAPEAKLIFILRNPINRAYSHYWHSVRYGYEELSFESALALEKTRIEQSSQFRRAYSYVDRGKYYQQLKRFFDLFPAENILVLILEEFQANYELICQQCGDFLGIDSKEFVAKESLPKVFNKSRVPRINLLAKMVRNEYERFNLNHGEQPISFWAKVNKKFNWKTIDYPPMATATRKQLIKEFTVDILQLQELTKLDLGHWL